MNLRSGEDLIERPRGIDTGELRRKLFPDRGLLPGAPPSPLVDRTPGQAKQFKLDQGLHQTRSGLSLYWESIVPADDSKIERVLILFHGLSDNVGGLTGNHMLAHAQNHNVAVIAMDLPGHGRSDGLHLYIDEWHAFVDQAMDFVISSCKPKVEAWSKVAGRPLQLYAHGESLGGGVVTTMCLLRPDIFDGVVLIAPMIYISDDMMPDPAIVTVFERILAPLVPAAKIAPNNENLGKFAWSDPEQVRQVGQLPLTLGKDRLRARTAHSMVVGCRWMWGRLREFRTPFLVLHAKGDRITDSAVSKRLFEEAATRSEDKRLLLLDSDFHADFMSGGPSQKKLMDSALTEVITWMTERDAAREVGAGEVVAEAVHDSK